MGDLFISADLQKVTEIWMGHRSEKTAAGEGLINLVGSQELEEKMPKWPGQSPFAAVQHAAA